MSLCDGVEGLPASKRHVFVAGDAVPGVPGLRIRYRLGTKGMVSRGSRGREDAFSSGGVSFGGILGRPGAIFPHGIENSMSSMIVLKG